jgi:hypothetical protein
MTEPFDAEDPTPRAASGKRPPAAASVKPAAPGKPVPGKKNDPPQAEPAEPRLNWGHVGSVTKPGRLSDGTSRPGVIRVVEANITYDPPPLDAHVWVPASMNFVGQFEMAWPEGNPLDARTLGDLGNELRVPNPPKARLAELDHAADSLLDAAQRLHSHDSRIGLLQPGNVLIVPGSDGRRLVLPDLGFTWRGSHGKFPWKDSPGRPRWLAEDARENPNSRLWDEEPVWRQFASQSEVSDDHELVPVQSDLKSIARVFAGVLTGRVDRDIVAPNAAPVWGVLKAAAQGQIKSAEEFRSRLSQHPLSEHWLAAKAPGPKGGGAVMALGLLLLALLGLGGGAVLYFMGVFNSNPAAGTSLASASQTSGRGTKSTENRPPTIKTSAQAPKRRYEQKEVDWRNLPTIKPVGIEDLVKQFQGTSDYHRRLELLGKMYDYYVSADEPTRIALRPWIEYLRNQYLIEWEKRYRAADDSVIKNVGLRYEAGKQIYDLYQELFGLRQNYPTISPSLNERENECLLISDLRSRELGSPR